MSTASPNPPSSEFPDEEVFAAEEVLSVEDDGIYEADEVLDGEDAEDEEGEEEEEDLLQRKFLFFQAAPAWLTNLVVQMPLEDRHISSASLGPEPR